MVGQFGFSRNDSGATTNNITTYYGVSGGYRKYLKTDELAPFIEVGLGYSSSKIDGKRKDNSIGISANAGAEYFLSKQFSIEGSLGVYYQSTKTKYDSGTSLNSSYFQTLTSQLGINFYF